MSLLRPKQVTTIVYKKLPETMRHVNSIDRSF